MIHTAAEIIQKVFDESPHDAELKYLYEKALNEARIEAIKECAEVAEMIYWDGFHKVGKPTKYFQSGADNLQPNKNAILKLIDQIK